MMWFVFRVKLRIDFCASVVWPDAPTRLLLVQYLSTISSRAPLVVPIHKGCFSGSAAISIDPSCGAMFYRDAIAVNLSILE